MFEAISEFIGTMGFWSLHWQHIVMILVSIVLLYLAIVKGFEPLLLVPIAFGCFLANLPNSGLLTPATSDTIGGLFYYVSYGLKLELFPPLIFLGIGAMTDFGPLLANPKTFLLGAAAQLGVYAAFFLAYFLGFTLPEAASIGIIGGADGPTAIFLTNKLAPHLLGAIAVAAYSYMALIPLIQPPIMRLVTNDKERKTVMPPPPVVSKWVKIAFPIMITFFSVMVVPAAAPLIAMLMGGNLLRESGVVDRLTKMAQNELMNIVTLFLGVSVGMKMSAEVFLTVETIKIIILGVIAFGFSTFGGLVLGKIMYYVTKGKVNPLIGSAGVSAVPMAARVSHDIGLRYNPNNYLLMHAMGPNVAGVVGSAVAAGALLAFLY
ncbi:MAG: sodium ion-translocating decarboxylase subunit beta [Ignavibacteria bacterium]|mgnify:FL=1|jgi:sodium ion-translocating decarboxylase beta subunit|nr:sodium ion-translocating decarboxylase subunit beta [Ignavibacteria bacterium]